MKEIGDDNKDNINVIIGGVIPPQDYEKLRSFGVKCIFGPGTKITNAALETLDAIRNANKKDQFKLQSE